MVLAQVAQEDVGVQQGIPCHQRSRRASSAIAASAAARSASMPGKGMSLWRAPAVRATTAKAAAVRRRRARSADAGVWWCGSCSSCMGSSRVINTPWSVSSSATSSPALSRCFRRKSAGRAIWPCAAIRTWRLAPTMVETPRCIVGAIQAQQWKNYQYTNGWRGHTPLRGDDQIRFFQAIDDGLQLVTVLVRDEHGDGVVQHTERNLFRFEEREQFLWHGAAANGAAQWG